MPIFVDAAIGVLPGSCNALAISPVGGGSLGGSYDIGLTSAAFTVDATRGRFQVAVGAPLLDERCSSNVPVDIDNRGRSGLRDRGAFESP